MKISPTMRDALDRMAADGGRLVRLPGGFWTTPGLTGALARHGAPAWWVGVQTVRSLEARGLVARAGEHAEDWRDPRVLVVS